MGRGFRERPCPQQRAPPQPDGPRDHGLQRRSPWRTTTSTTTPSASASTIPRRRGCRRLSGRPRPYGNWHVVDNHVHDNNEPNTAPGGSRSAQLPPGGGILVLGVDHVDVQKNRIENNDFVGIGMIDYCVAVAGTAFDCASESAGGRGLGAGRQPGHREQAGRQPHRHPSARAIPGSCIGHTVRRCGSLRRRRRERTTASAGTSSSRLPATLPP